jgi:hypothetical protein
VALPVLDPLENKLNGNVDVMSSTELGILLRWKGIPWANIQNGKYSAKKQWMRAAGTTRTGWLI